MSLQKRRNFFQKRPKRNRRRNSNKRTGYHAIGAGMETLEGRRLLAFSDFVINEILADPPSGSDANGDGTASTSQDEFVELVNNGPAIDIGGWVLTDAAAPLTSPRHTFPSPTNVAAGQAVVVFGNGMPSGSFGGALVMTASGGSLGLNNGGDTVVLSDNISTTSVTYGSEGGNNNSLTRDPDLTGAFVEHNSSSSGLDFTPGFQKDGVSPFGTTVGFLSATETSGSTVVSESGIVDTINIVLSGSPTADVMVTVTPDNAEVDLGAGAGNPLTLIFTPSTANTAQVVTINAVDDSTTEGGHASVLSFSTTSSDTAFNGLTSTPITAAVQDNDVATFSPGDVVVNEVMQDPSAVNDSEGEYFELWNTTGASIDINGWTIRDEGSSAEVHTIDSGTPLTIAANGFLVLGVNDDQSTNGGIPVDYVYSTISLGNGTDGLIIEDAGGTVIDAVTWDNGATFPDPNGASMELNAVTNPGTDNDLGANWSTSVTPLASGDFGTPGAANSETIVSPEIDVSGNNVSITSGDVTPTATDNTDFGSAVEGGGAITRTFTIDNIGNDVLSVGTISISGSGNFAVSQASSSTVPAGGSQTFTITFTPATIGAQVATVSIANSDGDESPFAFDVSGVVSISSAPEIDISGNGQSIAEDDFAADLADGTDFGSVDTIVGSAVSVFTISNPGTAALVISNIVINGANASDFSLGTLPTSIPAGANETFEVTFDPTATGIRSATITVESNDSDEGNFEFAVQGTGVAVSTNLVINEVDSDTSDENNEFIELYDGGIGNTSLDGLVVVLFNGSNGLSYNAFDLDGFFTDASGYFVIGDAGVANVALVPGGFDTAGATSGGSDIQNGEDGVAIYVGSVSDFPNGTAASNTGLLDVVVYETGSDTDSTLPTDFGVSGVIDEDANGNREAETISRVPNGTGPFLAVAPTPGVANATVVLTPEIDVVGTTDFGSAVQRSSAVTNTFTIANSGNGPLTVSTASITGSGDFSITQPASSIAAGSTATFTVTFTPNTVGSQAATISIVSDDADEGTFILDVTGITTAALTPAIEVTGNGQAIASGATTPAATDGTDFGSVDVASGSVTRAFAISNSGTASLAISQITVTGMDAADFTVGSVPASVAENGTATFTVTFDPSAAGVRNATVTIASNDADEASYAFAVQGVGTTVVAATNVLINELDSDTTDENNEFIELYDGGIGNTALDGLVVVLFNGSGAVSYDAIDLDGFSTDASGFFVVGDGDVVGVDLVPPRFDVAGDVSFGSDIQNGEDGVALFVGNASDFPNGTSATSVNLLDSLVYETGSDADSTLPAAFGISGVINEDENGDKDTESVARSVDGTGAFTAATPTPSISNNVVVSNPGDAIQLDKFLWDINGTPDLHNGLNVGDELMYAFDVTNTGTTVLSDVSVSDPLPGFVLLDSVVEQLVAYDQLTDLSSRPGAASSLDDDLVSDFNESKAWDNFAIDDVTVLDAVTWAGSFGGSSSATELDTEFSIEIYGDRNGVVGSLLHSFVASGENLRAELQSGGFFEYHAMLPFTTLGAGDYWLSITAEISNAETTPSWFWSQGANPSGVDGYYSYVEASGTDGTPTPEMFVADADLGFTLHASRLLDFDGTLQPGEAVMFMGTYYVTQADIDAGVIVNTATAIATGANGAVVDTDSDSRSVMQNAAVSVMAAINGSPASTDEIVEAEVGSTVTWSYEVSNDGNVSLEAVEVVSDSGVVVTADVTSDENSDGILSPGETWMFTATDEATEGEFSSMDLITSTTVNGEAVSTEASTIYVGVDTSEPTVPRADFDGDGIVNFMDFLILSRNFGFEVDGRSGGDATGDGLVSFADFVVLSNSFGQRPAPAPAAVDQVFGNG